MKKYSATILAFIFMLRPLIGYAEEQTIGDTLRISSSLLQPMLHTVNINHNLLSWQFNMDKRVYYSNDTNGYGVRYKSFYMGAQFNTLNVLRSNIPDISPPRLQDGPHLTNGGLRLGSYLNEKTLFFMHAGFINHFNRRQLNMGNSNIKSKNLSSTVFAPSVGVEWHLPQKFSVRAEIGTTFNYRANSTLTNKRPNGTILFDLKYKLDNK